LKSKETVAGEGVGLDMSPWERNIRASGTLHRMPLFAIVPSGLLHRRNTERHIGQADAGNARGKENDRQDAKDDHCRAGDLAGKIQDDDRNADDRPYDPVSRTHVFLHTLTSL